MAGDLMNQAFGINAAFRLNRPAIKRAPKGMKATDINLIDSVLVNKLALVARATIDR